MCRLLRVGYVHLWNRIVAGLILPDVAHDPDDLTRPLFRGNRTAVQRNYLPDGILIRQNFCAITSLITTVHGPVPHPAPSIPAPDNGSASPGNNPH